MSLFHSGSKAKAFAHEHPSFFNITISISHFISNVNFKNYIYSFPNTKIQILLYKLLFILYSTTNKNRARQNVKKVLYYVRICKKGEEDNGNESKKYFKTK